MVIGRCLDLSATAAVLRGQSVTLEGHVVPGAESCRWSTVPARPLGVCRLHRPRRYAPRWGANFLLGAHLAAGHALVHHRFPWRHCHQAPVRRVALPSSPSSSVACGSVNTTVLLIAPLKVSQTRALRPMPWRVMIRVCSSPSGVRPGSAARNVSSGVLPTLGSKDDQPQDHTGARPPPTVGTLPYPQMPPQCYFGL